MPSVRDEQVLAWEEDEVVDFRGSIDWEPTDDGRDIPRDLPSQVILTVTMNTDGTIYDVIDQDMM